MKKTPDSVDVLVSIINYKTARMTIDCVASVLKAIPANLTIRIAIVDNRSDDGSVADIGAWIESNGCGDRVTLVAAPKNGGFSYGHNQGMAQAHAEYFLILNSDAVLRPDFFEHLIPAARAVPAAGLIAPQLEYDDGTVQDSLFRFHSPWSELAQSAVTGAVTKALSRRVVAIPKPVAPESIEWASFACILLKGEMVRAIGPMDEAYFLYFEDADYARTARRAGWQIIHVPEARAVHYRGGSGPVKTLQKELKRLPRYFYASRARFFAKEGGRGRLLLANLAWYLGRIIAHARRLAGRNVPPVNARQGRDNWTNFLDPTGGPAK